MKKCNSNLFFFSWEVSKYFSEFNLEDKGKMNQQRIFLLTRSFKLVAFIVMASVTTCDRLKAQSVDPLTGRAIINLPLGSINNKDLNASVNLTHQGGALQVNQGQGNAGMGWNVTYGGQISREVRGLPDELSGVVSNKTGWLFNNNATAIQGLGTSASYSFISGLGYIKDTEPDIYYFSAPGISGKFLFGADGQIKLIPYQDITVTSMYNSSFLITTNTGITYTFSAVETTTRQAFKFKETSVIDFFKTNYNYYKDPVSYNSTWHLTSMTSAATGAIITFSYESGEETGGAEFVARIASNGANPTTQIDTLYYIKDTVLPQKLNLIGADNYSIAIDWEGSLIYNVSVIENSGEGKSYSFHYKDIFSFGANDQYAFPSKRFLIKVTEDKTSICTSLPAYIFSYSGVDTTSVSYPLKNSVISGMALADWKNNWGQDYFGYNNGKFTNKNIPTIYYYATESGARKFRVTPIPGLTATQVFHGVNTTQQMMSVDPNWNAFGALWGIYYPTGGVTTISYEPNKYFDPSTNEELFGPGVRVSAISTSGGESGFGGNWKGNTNQYHGTRTTYEYKNIAGTQTSGRILYPPSFVFSDGTNFYRSLSSMGTFPQVYYGRVKESTSGYGNRVYEYDVPNMYPDSNPVTPLRKSSSSATPTGDFADDIYAFPHAPLQDLDFKRGALLKVSEFPEGSTIPSMEREMTYSLPQSNTTIQAMKYESVTAANGAEVFNYSIYQIPIAQSQILTQEVVRAASEETPSAKSTTTTVYQYNAKNMLVKTTKTNDDNSILVQDIKYALDYAITAPASGDDQANAIFKLKSDNRYSEVIESIQTFTPRGGTAVTAAARLSVYKLFDNIPQLYQTKSYPQGPIVVPSYVQAGATQSVWSDPNYLLEQTIEYKNSLPINTTGIDLVTRSVHYATGSIPVANFVNCKAANAVYEGFEIGKERGLEYAGSVNWVWQAGWTGKRSGQLTNTSWYRTSSSDLIVKSGNSYRVSMWVNSSQPGTVRVTIGGTTTYTDLSFTTTNQWVYLEKNLDVTNVASPFYLTITTLSTTAIWLDDFVALPVDARVSFSTVRPMVGVTAQTDDRGNSVRIDYDIIGRKSATLDRQRNLIEVNDYSLQRQPQTPGTLLANIGYYLQAGVQSNVTKYVQSQQVLFSASDNCLSQVSYTWTFVENGVLSTMTGKDVSKTFTTFGEVTVKLVVSSPGYQDAVNTQKICVSPITTVYGVSLSVSPWANTYNCNNLNPNDDNIRTFTATITGGSLIGWNLNYLWEVTNSMGQWTVATATGNQFSLFRPEFSFQVRCTIKASKPSNYPYSDCNAALSIGSASIGVTYIVNANCQ